MGVLEHELGEVYYLKMTVKRMPLLCRSLDLMEKIASLEMRFKWPYMETKEKALNHGELTNW